MAFNFTLPLRIVQAVFTIVVLGLTAYVCDWWTSHWHANSPTEINYLIFVAVWTILALAYLVVAPARFPAAAHKFAMLGVEALTMLFWFAGFIALAVWLDDRVCFGSVCASAKAATVFAAFEWFVFAATTVLAALHVWRTRGSNNDQAAPEMQMNV
ncbi:hypothetical protein UCDDS831_g02103 [Diplodia seriata]|uniref:MARVEL domain-containing protein n=1 Tax=Diplodia seriata TaxID=420778 RepID=A0A0G2GQ03_9PEZI|nr:hypothetical protein UCDDS831_g02103 [Diplodia seriata]